MMSFMRVCASNIYACFLSQSISMTGFLGDSAVTRSSVLAGLSLEKRHLWRSLRKVVRRRMIRKMPLRMADDFSLDQLGVIGSTGKREGGLIIPTNGELMGKCSSTYLCLFE